MVSTIEREDAKIVESIKRNRKTSDIAYQIPEGDQKESTIVLNFIRSRRNIKTNGDPNNPEIYIYLYITGSIVNYTGNLDFSIQEHRKELEDKLSKEIEDSIMRSVTHFQELGIDPISIGDFFRRNYIGQWKKKEWNDIFQRANITVHVEPRIVSTGTIH